LIDEAISERRSVLGPHRRQGADVAIMIISAVIVEDVNLLLDTLAGLVQVA
jgi:hypothetical protein